MVVLPLGLEVGRSVGAAATSFQTRFDWALVADQASARAAARYVNERIDADDVVIVSPHVAWLYGGNRADFFQMVAASGEPIAFYPSQPPRTRFAFDPSIERAQFAVLDPFWLRWAEAHDALRRITREIEAWPEVHRAGEFSVRRSLRA